MRASDFNIKKRDPNWKTLQAKRTSNAAGAHKDKKKAAKQGDVKHKDKEFAEDLTMKHQRQHNTQRRPDTSTSLTNRSVSHAEVDNVPKTADGHPTIKHRFHGKSVNTRVDPKPNPVKRKDSDRPIPKFLQKEVTEGVSYGSMPADAVRTLLHVYEKESQGVQQHHDTEGANRIGFALNDAAKSLGVSQYLKSLYNSAAHSAHMDFDTNPGDFKNWFTYVGDHLQGLYNIHKEKGSYDNDEPDTLPDEDVEEAHYRRPGSPTAYDRDYASSVSGFGRGEKDWDEGDQEPPNNFAIYINGKKWKVIRGNGYHADDFREKNHYKQLQDMAARKSAATGKKWAVHITGEAPTP